MRVPYQLLRETVSVEDFAGAGSRGPTYETARDVRASIQPTDRLYRDRAGQVASSDAAMTIRPEDGPVPVESRVTWGTEVFRVVSCFAMPDTRRPSQYELSLERLSR